MSDSKHPEPKTKPEPSKDETDPKALDTPIEEGDANAQPLIPG